MGWTRSLMMVGKATLVVILFIMWLPGMVSIDQDRNNSSLAKNFKIG